MSEASGSTHQQINEDIKNEMPQQGMLALLSSTKSEYEYLQKARNSLCIRAGVLIALLTAFILAVFAKDMPKLTTLFESNIVIAHITVICFIALFVSFLFSLISYVRVFFTKKYKVFSFNKFTDIPIGDLPALTNEQLVMLMYREYEECIIFNQNLFEKTIVCYQRGNKWLIAMIFFTAVTMIMSII